MVVNLCAAEASPIVSIKEFLWTTCTAMLA